MKHKILFINMPSRRFKVGVNYIPLGCLYAASSCNRSGHEAQILDLYLHDPFVERFDSGDYSEIENKIAEFNPDIIAFSGIASSYGRTKLLSLYLADRYPDITQIAGGALASVYEQLLKETGVSIVFHGEVERTIIMYLTLGVATIGTSKITDGVLIHSPTLPQIENIDDIPMPDYSLVDIEAYNLTEFPMITSRGCTNRCSFCYRHMKGYRQNSVEYVIAHIMHVRKSLGFTTFHLNDEMFNADKEWVLEFCDAVEPLGIKFSTSFRADNVDDHLLKRMKEAGCTTLYYGQESGSDTILKEFRKGITAKTNFKVTKATRDAGINCPVQIVIGSPSETETTIKETIKFLCDLGGKEISINYLIPYPGASVWKEALPQIPDIETYLDQVAHWGGAPVLNLTSIPDNIWRTWSYQIKSEVELSDLKKKNDQYGYLKKLIKSKVVLFGYKNTPKIITDWFRDKRIYG